MSLSQLADSLATSISRSPLFQAVVALFTEHPLFKFLVAAITALLGNGAFEHKVYFALAVVCVLDVILGIKVACKTKTYERRKVLHFMQKWIIYFIFMILAYQARQISMLFYKATEFAGAFIFWQEYDSCARHAAALGVKLPRIKTIVSLGGSFIGRIIKIDKEKRKKDEHT